MEFKAFGTQAEFTVTDYELKGKILQDSSEGYLEFTHSFNADGNEYVFFPACAYNGNRFEVLEKNYPPMFTPEEAGPDLPITITDVPRLEKDGSGSIEITTGDLSTPCVGVYSPLKKSAFFIFTIQEIDGINLGISYQKGTIGITWPRMRRVSAYRWPHMVKSTDKGIPLKKDREIVIPYKCITFSCGSIADFFQFFFKNRKCMGLDCSLPGVLPPDEQFSIQRDKFNAMNWRPQGGYYGVGTENTPGQMWQPGWVGGAMSSYALMKLGGPPEEKRALSTLRHLFKTQAACGFFFSEADECGNIVLKPDKNAWHLIRESADCLYFILKHFKLMEERNIPIPEDWTAGTRKLADAFRRLWTKYGQLGQFIDLDTGDIAAGGSTSGAIASAGLAGAAAFFGKPEYLETAKAIAEQYYRRDLSSGFTTGGPGEILQGPDSESAFGLLESFVVLYEHTGESPWLDRAEEAARFCSSWVVSYNYHFPPESEFGRLGMKTTGAVFANVQNKHAAPGICTLSGDSLLKLYNWTGNDAYLELLNDITTGISQYMSTEARPIWSWDVPKDASLLKDDTIKAEREKLPPGFICERVNMSDWESERCIGGVFNGSCWSETSNLLTLAEISR